jgi:hypothetical protein
VGYRGLRQEEPEEAKGVSLAGIEEGLGAVVGVVEGLAAACDRRPAFGPGLALLAHTLEYKSA